MTDAIVRVDADTHVDETEDTWEYLDESEHVFTPVSIAVTPLREKDTRRWIVKDLQFARPSRTFDRTGVTPEAAQLQDIPARLKQMDDMRVAIQVIYPTTFIRSSFVGHCDIEMALCRAYNRWLADRTEDTNGRLRWVAVLPMLSMGAAIDELEWAKEHGACGIFKKGVECGKKAGDRYFFPLYEAARDLDLPICIHTGSDGFENETGTGAIDAVQAFIPLMTSEVFDKFPGLRVGFIEAGASWIPFLLSVLAARDRRNQSQASNPDFSVIADTDLFRRLNIYVTLQSQDDLAYILQYGTEDNLLVGTDYVHGDPAAELRALDNVEYRATTGEISQAIARKILQDNPFKFYGIQTPAVVNR